MLNVDKQPPSQHVVDIKINIEDTSLNELPAKPNIINVSYQLNNYENSSANSSPVSTKKSSTIQNREALNLKLEAITAPCSTTQTLHTNEASSTCTNE